MAILNVVTQTVGQVGVNPNFVYIQTTDNNATVTTPGYLNQVGKEFQFNNYQMALVTTTDGGPGLYQVRVSSTIYQISLIQYVPDGVPLTNGQVLIGSTGLSPVASTLTAGAGIQIQNGAGSITISSVAGESNWNEVSVNTLMVPNNGYIVSSASQLTFTLPPISPQFATYEISGGGTGTFIVGQSAGQTTIMNADATTTGTGGSISVPGVGAYIKIITYTANTTFLVLTQMGGPQNVVIT